LLRGRSPWLAAFGGTKVHWTFVYSASLCGKTHEITPDTLA
jgi:hypothetical protein